MEVSIGIAVFRDVMSCGLIDAYRRLGRIYCLSCAVYFGGTVQN